MRLATSSFAKQLICFLAAGAFFALPMVDAEAAPITSMFHVTLPSATAGYAAGHVFDISVTYDDAGTELHAWGDGSNGKAEFGMGDDTLDLTAKLASYPGYTLLSDAQITITGRAAPPLFAIAFDAHYYNQSAYSEFGNPSTSGYSELFIQADNLYMRLRFGGADSPSQSFILSEYFGTSGIDSTSRFINVEVADGSLITRTSTAVPEPGTLGLLWLGLVGLGFARRKRGA